eukprot:2043481-Rhodomonas_salina.1
MAWAESPDFEPSCAVLLPRSTEEPTPLDAVFQHLRSAVSGACLKAADEYCHPALRALKAVMYEPLHDRLRAHVNWTAADFGGGLVWPNRSAARLRLHFPNVSLAGENRSEFVHDFEQLLTGDRLAALANRTALDMAWEAGEYCSSPCSRTAASFGRYLTAR